MTALQQAFLAQAAFAFLLPPVLAYAFNRRTAAGWRWFGYGMLVFLVLELVMFAGGLAWAFVSRAIGAQVAAVSPAIMVAGIGMLSAIVEEAGRYFGYTLLFGEQAKTWARGVMYGLGHGGFESMLNKTLTSLLSALALALAPTLAADHYGMAPAQAAAIRDYAKSLGAMTPWQVIPPTLAIASGLAMHCACAVLVLQVFRSRGMKWLGGAIALHGAFDLTMGMGYVLGRGWMVAALAIAWAIVCVALALAMRSAGEEMMGAELAESAAVPARNSE